MDDLGKPTNIKRELDCSLDEVLKLRELMYEASAALVKKKGHDYNRVQQGIGDTLYNLQVCEILGITDSQRGILVRFSDKVMRLVSLAVPEAPDPEVTNEPVFKTVADIHNYADYLLIKYLKRKGLFDEFIKQFESGAISAL